MADADFQDLGVGDVPVRDPSAEESLSGVDDKSGYRVRFNTGNLVSQIGKNFHKAMKQIAPQMEAEMKDLAPVDTGLLRSTIKVRAVQGANPRLDISTVGYGFFVEKGTSKMEAQPFIMPVVLNSKWIRQIARIVKSIQRGG